MYKNTKLCFFLFTLLLASFGAKAQYLEFVENKGQWPQEVLFKTQLPGSAIYLTKDGYKTILHNPQELKALHRIYGGHSHDNHDHPGGGGGGKTEARAAAPPTPPDRERPLLNSHAWQVRLLGMRPNALATGQKKLVKKLGYFWGSDASRWGADCQVFQAVEYAEVYPGINLRFYTEQNQVKYEFVVKPGADPSQIILQYDGITGLGLNKLGQLQIPTTSGLVQEGSPYTYTTGAGGRQQVANRFVVVGNQVRFTPENYDRTQTLVIDPIFIFAAYSGSRTDNWGYTATFDGDGNLYGGGISFGSGYPVRNGPVNNGFNGGESEGQLSGYDMTFTKWNSTGRQQLYGLYVGGAGNEQPHSMIVDNQGRLYVAGRTTSTNFPTTQPLYGPGGQADIVIFRISPTGNAINASRRFGGSQNDGVNIRPKFIDPSGRESIRFNYGDDARSEILLDPQGNVLLASNTRSADYPITPGALQTSLSGAQDGVYIRVSADLSNVLSSTYFGGGGDDANFVLRVHPTNGDVYIGGSTTSPSLPGTGNAPVLAASALGGGTDGYVTRMNLAGTAIVATTFIGTNGSDMLYGIDMDRNGDVFVMGTTTGIWPVINAAFQQNNGKQYIQKISADLNSILYSTRFGKGLTQPDISPIAFLVDRCGNVYVSGWGGSVNQQTGYGSAGTNGLSIVNSVNNFPGDGSDFYLFVLERNATAQLYGGYIGANGGLGDHVDGGTSRFDAQGAVYHAVCSCVGNGTGTQGIFPTQPAGVESPTNNSGGACNLAVFKILLDFAGVSSSVRSSINGQIRDTSGCVPLTVNFTDTIGIAKRYVWNFGDGTPDETTTNFSIDHVFTAVGTYRVRLVAIDSSTCNIADTSFLTIKVGTDRVIPRILPTRLPPCDSLRYAFTNASINPTTKPYNLRSFVWDFGDGSAPDTTDGRTVNHSFRAPGTYTIRLTLIDTNFCNSPEFIDTTLNISNTVVARFTTPASGCLPYTAQFVNNSAGGVTFFWDFGDGVGTSTDPSPSYTYTRPGTFIVRMRVVDSNTCNIVDSARTIVRVSQSPTAIFSFSPNPPQDNLPVNFTNRSTPGNNLYRWNFGDGDSVLTRSRDTVISHQYQRSGTFNACLRATNEFGCFSDTCSRLRVTVIPLLDVPNAFTPNGDGNNDRIFVLGFGISKMNWKIYNRWGQLIFQSTSINQGWDGSFGGVRQPLEVYTYTLDVEFFDGTKHRKTGDITLLR